MNYQGSNEEYKTENNGSHLGYGYQIEENTLQTSATVQPKKKNNKIIPIIVFFAVVISLLVIDNTFMANENRNNDRDLARQNKASFRKAMSILSNAKIDKNMSQYLENSALPKFTSVEASSSRRSKGNNSYKPENAYDKDIYTCWSEGVKGLGAGEWIRFTSSEKQYIKGLIINNGNQKNKRTLRNNSLAKKISIEFSDGTSEEYDLIKANTPLDKAINIKFKKPKLTKYIKITILEGQKGENDKKNKVCISEVKIY